MTPQVLYCFEDEPVDNAARLMERRAVRRVIVLNRKKRMVGIISLDDLVTLSGHERRAREVLERVTKPQPPAVLKEAQFICAVGRYGMQCRDRSFSFEVKSFAL